MILLELKDVRKSYGYDENKVNAINHIHLTIDEGSFVAIIGKSGSGKSTLLHVMGGLTKPQQGTVLLEGNSLYDMSDDQLSRYRRRRMGFVFQFYNLISNLNTLENVEFAIEVSQKSLNPKDILKRVGLSERLKNFPSQLSGGEQQRVSIARAIAKNPLLLLCDEPTGALDYETGKEVLQLIKELNESTKKSVVLITHNSAISKIADKVIHVRSGQIEKIEYNSDKIPVSELEW
jgi:putative ABC transport system ATP-binding protein